MSKILMPSHDSLIVAGWFTLLHESFVRDESVDRTSRFPYTEMSFWPPGHSTRLTRRGSRGRLMSKTAKPWKFPAKAYLPWNAMSEFGKSESNSSPFGTCATWRRFGLLTISPTPGMSSEGAGAFATPGDAAARLATVATATHTAPATRRRTLVFRSTVRSPVRNSVSRTGEPDQRIGRHRHAISGMYR